MDEFSRHGSNPPKGRMNLLLRQQMNGPGSCGLLSCVRPLLTLLRAWAGPGESRGAFLLLSISTPLGATLPSHPLCLPQVGFEIHLTGLHQYQRGSRSCLPASALAVSCLTHLVI